MIKKGDWIQIQSYKHDGSLHRCWDHSLVLDINENFIVLGSKKTKVTEADGRRWYTREPAISIFSFNDWYNVIEMLKEEGISYYCNIASPTLIDKDIAKYIDYDLDLKLFHDGLIKVLDENEYARHKEKYHYSDKLDRVLVHEVDKIYRLMNERDYPFNDGRVMQYYDEFKAILDEQFPHK